MYNSIYPAYQNPYLGINNNLIRRKKEEDEKSSQASQNAENNPQEERKQQPQNQSYFPNGEKVAIDYSRRRIGIEQVLSDFKNTANAIGAPENIKAEVDSYLSLIENQSQKETPNPQIIQANLKSASQILDEYITDTLKKPSKVVENWVDTLFLQHIEYKATAKNVVPTQEEIQTVEGEIVEDETPLISGEEEQIVEDQISQDETRHVSEKKSGVYVPQDPQLRRMFLQAKKYAAIDQKERALYSFQNVREYAEEIGDEQASAIIHYEEARLYDDFDKIEDALYCYDRAARQSEDNNIKAKSHMYMGKIYDDYVRLDPAIDHYCAAASYAGEADNLKLQTKVLSDLAQIHTEKYDKQNALMFMGLSDTVATETKDSKTKAFISAKNARNCERLGENARALNYYGSSTKDFSDIRDSENMAKNYLAAAEVMLKYGNHAKAKKLLAKAYISAQETLDVDLIKEIASKIAVL